jgi:hypothetical protein
MAVYGTISSLDTLATSQATVYDYGENNAYQAVQDAFDAYNAVTREMLGDLVEFTTDNVRSYGSGADVGEMEELDQFGSPDAQKLIAGVDVGFPLRAYGRALQLTRSAQMVMPASELAAQITGIMSADSLNIQRQIKKALYTSTNATVIDRLVNQISLPVKALFNNDGSTPPPGPNGEAFATSHTHYLGVATFTEAGTLALISTVVEHRNQGQVVLYINSADEATVRAFTSFVPDVYPGVTPANSAAFADGMVNVANQKNRRIGLINGIEVWIKPWVIALYPVAVRLSAAKPLVFRQRQNANGFGDLGLVYDDETFPLRARGYLREFGISVWNRDAAAVAYMGNATYSIPSIS